MLPTYPEQLIDDLSAHGLQALGHCATVPTDNLQHGGTLVLIGPQEPAFWPIFSQSAEYRDQQKDPLDRWSLRVIGDLAEKHGAIALFPFGGPPFQPVFTWALRTGRFWSSPIGFLVHDVAGLFVSFRGVLLLDDAVAPTQGQNPCITCTQKPCIPACPVNAFHDGYDVVSCKSHLRTAQGTDCMSQGCRSRRACPIGQGNRMPAQATHHMKAFL